MNKCLKTRDFVTAIQLADILIADDDKDREQRRTTGVWPNAYWPHCVKAEAHIALGERDKALNALEETTCEEKGELLKRAYDLADWSPPRGAQTEIYAVIIGVNSYDQIDPPIEAERHSGFEFFPLKELFGAANDAQLMLNYLISHARVPEENVVFLSQGRTSANPPTHRHVSNALKWISEQEGDQVVFFFAGHGMKSRKGGNLMLLQDSKPWDWNRRSGEPTAVEETSISVQQVVDALVEAEFEERIMLIDACRRTLSRKRQFEGSLRRVTLKPSIGFPPVVLFATLTNDVAEEWRTDKGQGHGYFTYFLVEHLHDSLPLARLDDEVREAVSQATDERQKPGLKIFEEADRKDDALRIRIAAPSRE